MYVFQVPCTKNNREVDEPDSQTSGEGSSISWSEASPKLCWSESKATFEVELICACPSDEVNEGRGEEIAFILDRVVRVG